MVELGAASLIVIHTRGVELKGACISFNGNADWLVASSLCGGCAMERVWGTWSRGLDVNSTSPMFALYSYTRGSFYRLL